MVILRSVFLKSASDEMINTEERGDRYPEVLLMAPPTARHPAEEEAVRGETTRSRLLSALLLIILFLSFSFSAVVI